MQGLGRGLEIGSQSTNAEKKGACSQNGSSRFRDGNGCPESRGSAVLPDQSWVGQGQGEDRDRIGGLDPVPGSGGVRDRVEIGGVVEGDGVVKADD